MNGTSKIITLSLLSLSLWGCSSHNNSKIPDRIRKLKNLTVYAADAKPVYKITFKRDASFSNTNGVLIGGMISIAVDDSGKVYVADDQQHTIDVFEPDGRYLMHFGRKGAGPGEFRGFITMEIKSHQLFVYDPVLLRITTFSLSPFSFKSIIPLQDDKERMGSLPDYLFALTNGNFIVGFPYYSSRVPNAKSYIRYYLLKPKGNVISGELFRQKNISTLYYKKNGLSIAIPLPFKGKPLIVVSEADQIYTGWTQDFLVKVYNSDGQYLRAFYYPYAHTSFDQNKYIAGHPYSNGSPFKGAYQKIKFPKTWPALNGMMVDDQSRLWVSTIVKNMKVYKWWILTDQGKLLARFTWPRDKRIEVIKNGHLYTRETNKKTGAKVIVRYKIQMR